MTLLFRLSLLALLLCLLLPPLQPFLLLSAILTGVTFLAALLAGIRSRRPARNDRRVVVIDGSNVMHWRERTPRIETLREVIDRLRENGFTPGVVFDANAGHLLTGRYRHDDFFAQALGLARTHVMVVPKGTQADPMVLQAARNFDTPVIMRVQADDRAFAIGQISFPRSRPRAIWSRAATGPANFGSICRQPESGRCLFRLR